MHPVPKAAHGGTPVVPGPALTLEERQACAQAADAAAAENAARHIDSAQERAKAFKRSLVDAEDAALRTQGAQFVFLSGSTDFLHGPTDRRFWAIGPAKERRLPITAIGRSTLYRAIVAVPDGMAERGRSLQERVVFFEAHRSDAACGRLETLLAHLWQVDTTDWGAHGCIYNVYSAHDLLDVPGTFGSERRAERALLEIGCGGTGPDAIGPDRSHYARREDIDLFVSPLVAARLLDLLAETEALRAAEPARRAAARGGAV